MLATAQCKFNDILVADGPIDGVLTASIVSSPPTTVGLYDPRLAPDGDRMLVARIDSSSTANYNVALYDRTGATWAFRQDVYVAPGSSTEVLHSTPASDGRFLLYTASAGQTFSEFAETSPQNWTIVATHTTAELGVAGMFPANLSPDGLRIVFQGTGLSSVYGIYYADRANVGVPFNPASLLAASYLPDPFMTSDCGRLYFDAIGTTFYAQQQ